MSTENEGFIIVVGDDSDMTGWCAPKGRSGAWNCNRWSSELYRVKRYNTELAAQTAIARNQLALPGSFFPARVITPSKWKQSSTIPE